ELDRAEPGTGKEIQLTDAIKRTLGNHPVVAYEFEGDYYDPGTVRGYLRANLMLAMSREGLREELAPLLREMLETSAEGQRVGREPLDGSSTPRRPISGFSSSAARLRICDARAPLLGASPGSRPPGSPNLSPRVPVRPSPARAYNQSTLNEPIPRPSDLPMAVSGRRRFDDDKV